MSTGGYPVSMIPLYLVSRKLAIMLLFTTLGRTGWQLCAFSGLQLSRNSVYRDLMEGSLCHACPSRNGQMGFWVLSCGEFNTLPPTSTTVVAGVRIIIPKFCEVCVCTQLAFAFYHALLSQLDSSLTNMSLTIVPVVLGFHFMSAEMH